MLNNQEKLRFFFSFHFLNLFIYSFVSTVILIFIVAVVIATVLDVAFVVGVIVTFCVCVVIIVANLMLIFSMLVLNSEFPEFNIQTLSINHPSGKTLHRC